MEEQQMKETKYTFVDWTLSVAKGGRSQEGEGEGRARGREKEAKSGIGSI